MLLYFNLHEVLPHHFLMVLAPLDTNVRRDKQVRQRTLTTFNTHHQLTRVLQPGEGPNKAELNPPVNVPRSGWEHPSSYTYYTCRLFLVKWVRFLHCHERDFRNRHFECSRKLPKMFRRTLSTSNAISTFFYSIVVSFSFCTIVYSYYEVFRKIHAHYVQVGNSSLRMENRQRWLKN